MHTHVNGLWTEQNVLFGPLLAGGDVSWRYAIVYLPIYTNYSMIIINVNLLIWRTSIRITHAHRTDTVFCLKCSVSKKITPGKNWAIFERDRYPHQDYQLSPSIKCQLFGARIRIQLGPFADAPSCRRPFNYGWNLKRGAVCYNRNIKWPATIAQLSD